MLLKDLGATRVLDFGCGFGEFLAMSHLFVIEVEGDDGSIGRRSSADVQVYGELDEAPGQFDTITMFEVLEHLDDPLEIVLSLKSRLKPGGTMVVEGANIRR